VLQGLGGEREAGQVEALLRRCEIVPMGGQAIAANFRAFRKRGITVCRTIDLLIGNWCIENRRPLQHNDNDFKPMAQYLGSMEAQLTA